MLSSIEIWQACTWPAASTTTKTKAAAKQKSTQSTTEQLVQDEVQGEFSEPDPLSTSGLADTPLPQASIAELKQVNQLHGCTAFWTINTSYLFAPLHALLAMMPLDVLKLLLRLYLVGGHVAKESCSVHQHSKYWSKNSKHNQKESWYDKMACR